MAARLSRSQTLNLWANGLCVGRWTLSTRGDMELQYDTQWLASPAARPISLSLPVTFGNAVLKGESVVHYFDNLLPDNDGIRRRIATRFKTGSTDAFDLLAAIGRDCVGALQLLPEGKQPQGVERVEGVVVDEAAIEKHLLEMVAPDQAMGAARDPDDDFRISLAGAQEKDAFTWWRGQWMKPRGTTPTTHIFKMPLGMVGGRRADFSTSVDNEWLCLRLLRAYGLPAARADIATFGAQRVLVVERFDRRLASSGTHFLRLMQEDFCQASGSSPLLKYESDGGPGLKALFSLLHQSTDPQEDLRTLMASQVLFWMLRAPDGHAKNFSIQLQAGAAGRFRLTPLYDVMSAYPVMGDGPNQRSTRELKLAMALLGKNRHYLMDRIERRHFNSTARAVGFGETAEPLIEDLIARTPGVIEQVKSELPPGFSQLVADRILGGLQGAAEALERMAR